MSPIVEEKKNPLTRLYIVLGVLFVATIIQWQTNIIPLRQITSSIVPTAVELPTAAPSAPVNKDVAKAAIPSSGVSTKTGSPRVRMNIWAWNAQMGLIYANGGPKTTTASLMETHGVNLTLTRQDDTTKSQAEQIKFAQKLANGDPNPAEGIHFVSIMGDGAFQYIAGINTALKKLGPNYQAEIVGSVGYSGNSVSGEDAFMGPEDWRTDPNKAKGGLVSGVLRDGDWNIAMYWAQQNGLKNNPDETTWDPDAINWLATDDYIKAGELYINGVCEDRKVVRDGKLTSEPKHHVCVQGVVTWTPGDVNVVKKKGGIVKLLSTKENAFQMPAVLIGIRAWDKSHPKAVQDLLAAAFEGADQVRNFDDALQRAGKASFAVYNEESPAYWVRYYKGTVEKGVPLGGSRVSNLGDNLALFGLGDGTGDVSSSMFRATYEGFGNIAHQQYPKLIPTTPNVSDAVNLTFLQALASSATSSGKLSKPEDLSYEEVSGTISDKVAQKDWNITFDTGKATFTQDAMRTLNEVYNALAVNKLYVQLDGHTDNTGNSQANVALSQARAEAVRSYLRARADKLFPNSRVGVEGFGDTKPVAPNTTPDGRAQNRRVTVTIGNK